MNWLITGGCGFIGSSLISKLILDDNISIRILDNLSVGDVQSVSKFATIQEQDQPSAEWKCKGKVVELVVGDICDAELTEAAAAGADVIVHLAANTGVEPSVKDPKLDCITNVIGTLNCLEAAREAAVSNFVFASSGAPIGEAEPPIHENLAPHPVSPYGASKLAGEGYCSAYARTFGVHTVALRFGNVYGTGSTHKSSVVAKFMRKILSGESIEIYGDGAQTRDFIYIEDLVEAIQLAARAENMGGEVFQIATNRETSVGELTEKLSVLFAENSIHTKVTYGESRVGDVKRNFSDTSKALAMLKWQPKYSLDEGLRETLEYFMSLNLSKKG